MRCKLWDYFWLTVSALSTIAAGASAQPAVWTEHNDNNRSGDNLNESVLAPSNVESTSTFGKLWSVNIDDQAYTSPLYIPSLTINGGTHNVVFVATVNDSVYAFDADTGTQLWHVNLLISGDSVPSNAQASAWGACGGDYEDFTGKFGIVGTPVINTATNTMYLVARSYSGSTYVQQLHALNILTGADVDGGPVTISGSYNGSTWSPQLNNQRPALTLVNGVVYIAWSSHCDYGGYNGFVMGYNATNLAQRYEWADTTNGGSQGGIWMGGQGLTVDSSNDVYVMTGNGTWDGSSNFGESFVKLSSSLGVLDYFTPSTWSSLNGGDEDVGSAGSLLIPGTNYLVGGGKSGILYLLSTSNLGKEGNTDDVVQEFQADMAPSGDTTHIHGGPTWWNNGADDYVFVWGENDYLRCFQWLGSSFNSTAVATSTMLAPMSNTGMPGGFLSISANGTSNGILWALEPYNGNANQATVEGILHAFNANPNGSTLTELWNSKQNAGRDDFGNFAKFTYPTISNGKVYISTFGTASSGSGGLWCYGLLSSSAPSTPMGVTATASVGSVYLSWSAAGGATSYNVYRSTTSAGVGSTPFASGITVTSYSNTGLTNGTTYYYSVAAVNGAGTSAYSSPVSAEPTVTSPVQVNMSASYNVSGIYEDGSTFPSNGGFDGGGNAYSANVLGNSVTWNSDLFVYGPSNGPDCVSSATIALPSGSYTTLNLLAAAVNGNQTSQTFIVTYTDGTTQTFTQSLSDWYTPQSYAGESEVVTCPYRDEASGGQSDATFSLYGYSFALNAAKTVSSITLPNNRNVVVAAMDLIPSTTTEAPYGGTPAAIPGTVYAANYDTGGQGVAYDIGTNSGTLTTYRSDGVDLETCTDSQGSAVPVDLGWTASGQWFNYTVNVATAGTYTVACRVASNSSESGSFQIQTAGGTVLATVTVPNTGGWETWNTVSATVTLPAGQQTLKIYQNGNYNYHYLQFSGSASCSATPSAPTGLVQSGTTSSSTSLSWSSVTAPANCSISSYTVYRNGSSIGTSTSAGFSVTGLSPSTTYTFTVAATDGDGTSGQSSSIKVTTLAATSESPYGGTPAAIPGTVYAANYDTGGQGVAYDIGTNSGTLTTYRSDGVDLETCTDSQGSAVPVDLGWTASGQWFNYTVNVATAGTYTVACRVASNSSESGSFQIQTAGGTVLATVTVPNTGGWETWNTVSATVTLPAGQQTLKIYQNGDYNCHFVQFTAAGGPIANGSYTLTPGSNSGARLDVSSSNGQSSTYTSGETMQIFQATGLPSQSWNFTGLGSNEYTMSVDGGAYCLDSAGAISSGTAAVINPCKSGDTNQIWTAHALSGGGYYFSVENSGLCLDVRASGTANGTVVQTYTCNGVGGLSQTWTPEVGP